MDGGILQGDDYGIPDKTRAEFNAHSSAYPLFSPGVAGVSFGLTKRELFAAMAMQGMLSVFDEASLPHTWEGHPDALASIAVKCADALVNELTTTKKEEP